MKDIAYQLHVSYYFPCGTLSVSNYSNNTKTKVSENLFLKAYIKLRA